MAEHPDLALRYQGAWAAELVAMVGKFAFSPLAGRPGTLARLRTVGCCARPVPPRLGCRRSRLVTEFLQRHLCNIQQSGSSGLRVPELHPDLLKQQLPCLSDLVKIDQFEKVGFSLVEHPLQVSVCPQDSMAVVIRPGHDGLRTYYSRCLPKIFGLLNDLHARRAWIQVDQPGPRSDSLFQQPAVMSVGVINNRSTAAYSSKRAEKSSLSRST